VRNLIAKIKQWLIGKVTNWEEYWGQTLPNYERVFKTQNGKVLKEDGSYYENIGLIAENAAFMNQLAELQEWLKKRAFDAHSRLDHEQGSAFWQQYRGTEQVVKMILTARNKHKSGVANG